MQVAVIEQICSYNLKHYALCSQLGFAYIKMHCQWSTIVIVTH